MRTKIKKLAAKKALVIGPVLRGDIWGGSAGRMNNGQRDNRKQGIRRREARRWLKPIGA